MQRTRASNVTSRPKALNHGSPLRDTKVLQQAGLQKLAAPPSGKHRTDPIWHHNRRCPD
eukprot:CAMPEP_0115687428 /NCGR_PEP_ID=MMETSP0272-20121206/60481_1 /TAXON_ID=71861 /ORGANISM="Scrippsiella trochoidea, Strain CCMP3099" /LENGTH=58 /DNA_ID=CAMNT_0003127067 /DNA_START=193 /DNA_END=369 /DNA_ORIENTATION=+